jgi:hypothetical protein
MAGREYFGGLPQPTQQERECVIRLAPLLVEMVRKHSGSRGEIESQIAPELYCSVAMMRGDN